MARHFTKEEIKELIMTNDNQLYGALIALYNCQTDHEQNCETTVEHNCSGFNAADAAILTSFAKFLQKNRFLSDKQKAIARKKLPKYCKQLESLQKTC